MPVSSSVIGVHHCGRSQDDAMLRVAKDRSRIGSAKEVRTCCQIVPPSTLSKRRPFMPPAKPNLLLAQPMDNRVPAFVLMFRMSQWAPPSEEDAIDAFGPHTHSLSALREIAVASNGMDAFCHSPLSSGADITRDISTSHCVNNKNRMSQFYAIRTRIASSDHAGCDAPYSS